MDVPPRKNAREHLHAYLWDMGARAKRNPCRANLGETFDQCVARYGQSSPPRGYTDPDEAGEISYNFRKGGYMINALFFKDVDITEFITKEGGSSFSDDEKTDVLVAEGGKWAKSEMPSLGKLERWTRDDGATATYAVESPAMLLIANKNYATNVGGIPSVTHLFEIISLGCIGIIGIFGCGYAFAVFRGK